MDTKNVLDISQLQAQPHNAPLFVMNNTSNSSIGQSGDLVITVPRDTSGQPTIVRVAKSWIPQDLTTQVSRRFILDSTEFRNAISHKLLLPVTEEYANKLLSQRGAREELSKINFRRNVINPGQNAAQTLQDEDNSSTDISNMEEEITKDGVTENYKAWCERLANKDGVEALNEIRNRSRFTKKEARFLIDKLQPKTHKEAISVLRAAAGIKMRPKRSVTVA